MMKRRNAFFITLSALLVVCSGCRPSPVLEQVVYEQDHTEDPDQQSDDNQPDHTQQDEQLASMEQVDQARSQRDEEQNKAVSGGTAQNGSAYSAQYQEQAGNNGIDQTVPEQQTNPDNQTGSTGGGTSGQGDSQGTGGNDASGQTPSADEHTKQIVDARGVSVTVPENVDGVTATGEAGVMVGMLGGTERLMASSRSMTSNRLAQKAFGTGVSNVQTWWDGDGSGAISAADFQTLLAKKPDVCFEISGENTFSQDQVAQLNAAGIAYVVLPKLDTYDHIKEAVTLVGTVMGDRSSDGGTNAPAIAQQYAAWVDKVKKMVPVASSKKTTVFIAGWDATAQWKIYNSSNGVYQSGNGAAVAAVSAGNVSLGASMDLAGVNNNGLDATYANPLQDGAWLQSITGEAASQNRNYNLLSDLYTEVCLGEADFPAIVVANETIRDQIAGDIHWQTYGKIQNGPYSTDYGFMANGEFVKSVIHGSYDILVNPSGIGNWTDGSVESPMEALWMSCKFQDGCSMDQLRDVIREFYTTFYHMDVNTGDILGE